MPDGLSFFSTQSVDLALDLEQRVVPLDGLQGDRRDRLALPLSVTGTLLDIGQLKEFAPCMRMAKGKGDGHRFRFSDTEWLEAIVAITLQNATIVGQMLLRMLATPVTRSVIYCGWRCLPPEGPIITYIGPYAPGRAFVFSLWMGMVVSSP